MARPVHACGNCEKENLPSIWATMATPVNACGNCENENLPSVCAACANRQLQEKYKLVNALKEKRDSLYKRLDEKLKAKREAVEQRHWRQTHAERIAQLKETLRLKEKQLLKDKSELEEKTAEYNTRKSLQDETYAVLETNRKKLLKSQSDLTCTQIPTLRGIQAKLWQNRSVILKQLCKVFPLGRVRKPKPNGGKNKDKESSSGHYYDQICNVTLPKRLDPSSVTPLELAVSLRYMVQLLNLAARYLNAPLLLNFGFAGSSSRVWLRASYWNSRPAASKYYRLFFPGQNYSESEDPRENDSKHPRKSKRSSSRGLAFRDPAVIVDVQKGMYLVKRAAACLTDYCCNSLGLPIPTGLSTFDEFGNLLKFLSSKDGVTAIIMSLKDLKGSHSRNRSQAQQNPTISTFLHSNEMAEQKRAEGSDGIAEQKLEEGSGGSNMPSKDLTGSRSRNRSQAQQNPMTNTFIHCNEIAEQKRREGSGGIAEQKRREGFGGIAEQKRAEGSGGSNIVGNMTLPLQPSDEDVKEWLNVIMAEAKKKIDYHRRLR